MGENVFKIFIIYITIYVYYGSPGNELLYRGNGLLEVCNVCTRWLHNIVVVVGSSNRV